jgi:hypothetical protein
MSYMDTGESMTARLPDGNVQAMQPFAGQSPWDHSNMNTPGSLSKVSSAVLVLASKCFR